MVGVLENKREQIAAACARHGVLRLDAFGSAVRGDFRPGDSDVDLLVEFGPMDVYARVDAYFDLLDDFRGILGTGVDLVMVDAVKNRYLAADIERTKQALYAA
jgi:predicted nucleotidyltransferase